MPDHPKNPKIFNHPKDQRCSNCYNAESMSDDTFKESFDGYESDHDIIPILCLLDPVDITEGGCIVTHTYGWCSHWKKAHINQPGIEKSRFEEMDTILPDE